LAFICISPVSTITMLIKSGKHQEPILRSRVTTPAL
jgi:hypothetical protein